MLIVTDQTFGIDLEARARADKKRVPLVVTAILTHLDNNYPLLDGDEARRSIWLVDVPLAATHRLRNEINNGQAPPPPLLQTYEMPIVASTLKLYLLELPDSIVSSGLYEIIKTIYTSPTTSSDDQIQTRISVLQNTLGQLRLANIATLDALCTHFARLIDLTSASDEYVQALTVVLAPCILRSRTESALLFEEKYNVRFLRDLLAHKDAIFSELKRSAALQHSASVARAQSTIGTHAHVHHAPPALGSTPAVGGAQIGNEIGPDGARARAISTDESNRRAHMEERNRAIANRSRAASPAPGAREHFTPGDHSGQDIQARNNPSLHRPNHHGHRRDSSRGPETRFPVAPSGQHVARARENSTPDSPKGVNSPRNSAGPRNVRDSLEVPVSPPGNASNGMSATSGPISTPAAVTSTSAPVPPPKDDMKSVENGTTDNLRDSGISTNTSELEKHNSLGRARPVGRKGTMDAAKRSSMGSLSGLANRDSVGSVGSLRQAFEQHGVENNEKRGVELVDKPMDD